MVLFIRSCVPHEFLDGVASRGFGFSVMRQVSQSSQTVRADLYSGQMGRLRDARTMAMLILTTESLIVTESVARKTEYVT